jgi:hypothetical protein
MSRHLGEGRRVQAPDRFEPLTLRQLIEGLIAREFSIDHQMMMEPNSILDLPEWMLGIGLCYNKSPQVVVTVDPATILTILIGPPLKAPDA